MTEKFDELIAFAAPIAAMLPNDENDDGFRFSGNTIETLPEILETRGLIIKQGIHDYNGSWRIDYPQVYAAKEVYAALGVVTACVLLNSQVDQLEIRLTHPQSDIKSLIIEFAHPGITAEYLHGLYVTPTVFAYEAAPVERKPWLFEAVVDPNTFPHFELSNKERCPITEDDWNNRDVIFGFGSAEGTARLVQLLLDMSRPGNKTSEFTLESEGGFRGVAPLSAEICFWLPGGESWIDF